MNVLFNTSTTAPSCLKYIVVDTLKQYSVQYTGSCINGKNTVMQMDLHVCTRKQVVAHKGIHTSTHTLAKCVCWELAKMSSYVHGCLLSPPLSLFHSSTWWRQRAQRRPAPQERKAKERRPESADSLEHRPNPAHHVPLACQSNLGLHNFTLN